MVQVFSFLRYSNQVKKAKLTRRIIAERAVAVVTSFNILTNGLIVNLITVINSLSEYLVVVLTTDPTCQWLLHDGLLARR